MVDPRGWRRLVVPTLIVLPVLAILLALGTWQVERLRWKTDLLARIAASEAGPPEPLGAEPEPYRKVVASGRFDHGREALLGLEVRGPVLGAHLITPLERGNGAPPVLVNRGWVPLERGDAAIVRPEGEVRVEGYVRPADVRNWFSPEDDTAQRRFYTFDPAAIGAAMGYPVVEPFGLVALAPEAAAASPRAAQPAVALPDPARNLPRPPNNHLGYVITWYGLALALIGVFFVWARRRLKDRSA